jgi:DNA-binding NarL/FixJ family response regulator
MTHSIERELCVSGQSARVSIVLVDDHEVARSGLRTMLGIEPDFTVVGEAAGGWTAVQLCSRMRPDLVLMDVRMSEMDGITATREILRASPTTRAIIVTTYANLDFVLEARKAGAVGYLLKDASRGELVSSIRRVLRGENLLSPQSTGQIVRRMIGASAGAKQPAMPRLTTREIEVLRLIARGLSNSEIAADLGIGAGTVKTHVERLLKKLQVADRTQAAVRAVEWGIIGQPVE